MGGYFSERAKGRLDDPDNQYPDYLTCMTHVAHADGGRSVVFGSRPTRDVLVPSLGQGNFRRSATLVNEPSVSRGAAHSLVSFGGKQCRLIVGVPTKIFAFLWFTLSFLFLLAIVALALHVSQNGTNDAPPPSIAITLAK